jgi:MoxR-like ATPase
MGDNQDIATAGRLLDQLLQAIGSAFLGKPEVVQLTVTALLANGHLLLEDVPGVGKTLLARSLAHTLGCRFRRIQFTPDLLPSDLLGVTIYREQTGEFVFQPGPLFTEILLADEINRATPRTQSALLEAMNECQVTIDGTTYPLGPPFLVIATQNPYEFEGTFPLPESQLDRFLLRVRIGYPDRAAERCILEQHRRGEPGADLLAVLNATQISQLQTLVRAIRVDPALADYILDIVAATRQHPQIILGASTRAALALYRAAQAWALLQHRDYVVPDDIQRLAVPVLAHRLIVRTGLEPTSNGAEAIVQQILQRLPVPV